MADEPRAFGPRFRAALSGLRAVDVAGRDDHVMVVEVRDQSQSTADGVHVATVRGSASR
jgi:hypothetical protein